MDLLSFILIMILEACVCVMFIINQRLINSNKRLIEQNKRYTDFIVKQTDEHIERLMKNQMAKIENKKGFSGYYVAKGDVVIKSYWDDDKEFALREAEELLEKLNE